MEFQASPFGIHPSISYLLQPKANTCPSLPRSSLLAHKLGRLGIQGVSVLGTALGDNRRDLEDKCQFPRSLGGITRGCVLSCLPTVPSSAELRYPGGYCLKNVLCFGSLPFHASPLGASIDDVSNKLLSLWLFGYAWSLLQHVGSRVSRFSSCGAKAWLPQGMRDLSSPTRDRTHTPCIGSTES